MTCRDAIELLADYLDRTLPLAVLDELERHLAGCEPCRAYLATYRKTRALGAHAARIEMPDEMKARLRQFLLARLG
jgi:anti-sigma factor RsiW